MKKIEKILGNLLILAIVTIEVICLSANQKKLLKNTINLFLLGSKSVKKFLVLATLVTE